MARALNKLTARSVATAKEKGRYSDGGGLYLVVDGAGAKRWVVFYTVSGKRREMGAGATAAVPLARAREIAAEVRAKVAVGVDPISERASIPLPAPIKVVTFGDVADGYMRDREAMWKSVVHRRQWRQTLEIQAASVWRLPISAVDTGAVLAVLRPLWATKPETARRIRGRIEKILDSARAAGLRSGENPARWAGHLSAILPNPEKLTRGHHAALPYAGIVAFVAELRTRSAASARALELAILTAARSGEVRGMTWGEIDFAEALWTVPAGRMKAKRVHRVPLSVRAVEILAAFRKPGFDPGALVFPNGVGRVHSDMVFTALIRRMREDDAALPHITAHGFRSTFRDWAADTTDHAREVIEAALAHLVGDGTERAYRRGDALEKRRALMDHWGAFLSATGEPATKA